MHSHAYKTLNWEDTDPVRVIEALRAGRAVVFPTDTVYGLGVAVRYASSPREVSDLKRRDPEKPIAWLVADPRDLDRYGADVSEEARRCAEEGWPGALTVVVEASDEVPPAYRSTDGTIGLRVPANELALALIREVGPLAASSANLAGEPTPLRFDDIAREIMSEVAAIKDDAAVQGTPSTVIDFSEGKARTIR